MSLQQIITKFIFKLPDGLLVRMAGGKPVEVRGRVLEPQLQMVAWNGRNAPPMSGTAGHVGGANRARRDNGEFHHSRARP